MKNNTLSFVAVAVVITSLITFAVLRPSAPQGSAVRLIAGIDTSDSVRDQDTAGGTLLGRCIACLARLSARLDQHRDRVTIIRIDREAREFYDQNAPRSREKFQWLLISETRPAAKVGGTFPAKFWAKAAERAQGVTVPVAVCLFSDSDNDDLSATARSEMQHAAKLLADNPHVVAVCCYGAHSKNWENLRTVFAPLGDRLQLRGPEEMDPTPLLSQLETARHRPQAR